MVQTIGWILIVIGLLILGAGIVNLIANRDRESFMGCCIMWLISAVCCGLGSWMAGIS
jgi:hypothetical protein